MYIIWLAYLDTNCIIENNSKTNKNTSKLWEYYHQNYLYIFQTFLKDFIILYDNLDTKKLTESKK